MRLYHSSPGAVLGELLLFSGLDSLHVLRALQEHLLFAFQHGRGCWETKPWRSPMHAAASTADFMGREFATILFTIPR